MDCFGSNTAGYSYGLPNIAGIGTATPYPTMCGGAKLKKTKVVNGAKVQSRPSASYYYKVLKKPVGFKVSYRPRKGGKYILHSLQLRKNGVPYWKAEEKLPKLSKKKTTKRSTKKRTRKRTNKKGGNIAVPLVVGAAAVGLGAAGYMYYKNKKTPSSPGDEYEAPPTMPQTANCTELMCAKGLNDRKAARKYILRNHPDKNNGVIPMSEVDDYPMVISCNDEGQYCN